MIAPELPQRRSVLWNVWLLGTVLLSLVLIEFSCGGPWQEVAGIFGGFAVVGAGLGRVVFLIVRYRDPGERHLREQAKAKVEAPQQVHPVRAVRDAA